MSNVSLERYYFVLYDGALTFKNVNKNVNDIALIRHLATSNIANFMWYNFLLVKK